MTGACTTAISSSSEPRSTWSWRRPPGGVVLDRGGERVLALMPPGRFASDGMADESPGASSWPLGRGRTATWDAVGVGCAWRRLSVACRQARDGCLVLLDGAWEQLDVDNRAVGLGHEVHDLTHREVLTVANVSTAPGTIWSDSRVRPDAPRRSPTRPRWRSRPRGRPGFGHLCNVLGHRILLPRLRLQYGLSLRSPRPGASASYWSRRPRIPARAVLARRPSLPCTWNRSACERQRTQRCYRLRTTIVSRAGTPGGG